MNTLLLIFLAPFLTSTAVGQVESVQTQAPFLQTAALKFYCRYGSVLNEDVSGCTPKTVVQEQPQQTVQEKVVEVVRNVFVPVASAQEPSDSYLESMIRRIVLELLPQPEVITVKGEKGDKGDKGDPGTSGSNLLAFDGIQMPFWNGYGSGPTGGGTVVNNVTNIFGSSSTSTLTADNGLTINPANNVQLGGTLIQNTNIDLATRTLTFNQSATSSRFKIQGASGYGAGFSTQDIFQIETYANEGFAISSYETGPLVTDPHGTFLNFTSNLASPLGDPLGTYIYSDRTTGTIAMGRFAGGAISLDTSGVDILSEDVITAIAGSVQGFFANDNNLLVPGDAGFRFRTLNAASNDIAVANFDPGVGLGVNMFVGQFDPNTQFTGDPGDFYFNMSPVDDNDIMWVKGPTGGFGTNTGWVPVQAGTSSPTTAWLITGNGGTDPLNNFIGTTDGQDLVVRTNNTEVARFGQMNNFSFGYGAQALSSNMTVMGNNAGTAANNAPNSNFFGIEAGASAVNASMSNFIGFYAGNNATNAATSNFIGASAGNGATNAATSNFIGDSAGFNATDATFSNFMGYRAGFVSANASNSNFIGNEAGNGATDASNSNFIGQMAGLGSVNAQASNFIGFRSGLNATDAYRSNFFGYFSGQGALNANNSNFFGESAGQDALNANNSNFFGTSAGQNATTADNSNFFGNGAGLGAIDAFNSNFFGQESGYFASNAPNSNFFGHSAGYQATNADASNFFGQDAGYQATNAFNSNFFGHSAGNNAINAPNANFFGANAGDNATDANNSNFFGASAGNSATNANNSSFFGTAAGFGAVNANNSNFFGANAGDSAVSASNSNFFGTSAGSQATNANNSNFFGTIAGLNATNANNSNFFGNGAGFGATGAENSNFFGQNAGNGAVNVRYSNFFGLDAGSGATDAGSSNFFGWNAGLNASLANDSNFFGNGAGQNATNATESNFFGLTSGQGATNASNSSFFGSNAGSNATNAANSIFIGRNAGLNDTVNNTISGTSILIGANTNTGGFSNSIALGEGAVNTATNQLYIRDGITNFNLAGVNYDFPTVQGATSTLLINDGAGNLSWAATTSLGFVNHWQKNTNILSPNDAAVYQIAVTNNSASTLTGFKTTNTNDISNYAGAVVELKGSGADFTNNVYFGKYGSNFYIPSWAGNGVLATDKSLVLGALSTSSSINFQVGGGYVAPITKMTLSSTTLRLMSANFHLDGAFMPNNLAGATGTLLMSQGNGLAPVWMATSSLGILSGTVMASTTTFSTQGSGVAFWNGLGQITGSSTAFFWDNTTGRLSLNKEGVAATARLEIDAENPSGDTALRINLYPGNCCTGKVGLDVYGNLDFSTNSYLARLTHTNPAGGSPVPSAHIFTAEGGFSGTTVTGIDVLSTGDVGIGTTPYDFQTRLSVHEDNPGLILGANTTAMDVRNVTTNGATGAGVKRGLVISSTGVYTNGGTSVNTGLGVTVSGGDINYAALFNGGNVGIGTTTPSQMLQVGSVGNTGNIIVYGTGTTCTIGDGVGATLCSSDERLKHDITTATEGSLFKINSLRPVTYVWNTDLNRGTTTRTGLIAQEVEQVFPEFVDEVYDGYKGIDYAALVTPLIGAVQEIDIKIEDLTGGDEMPLTVLVNGVEEKTFVGRLFIRMTKWFADAGNGIQGFFAKKIITEELCISENQETFCISKDDLKALKNLLGSTGLSTTHEVGQDSNVSGADTFETESPIAPSVVEGEEIPNTNSLTEQIELEFTPEVSLETIPVVETSPATEVVQE